MLITFPKYPEVVVIKTAKNQYDPTSLRNAYEVLKNKANREVIHALMEEARGESITNSPDGNYDGLRHAQWLGILAEQYKIFTFVDKSNS